MAIVYLILAGLFEVVLVYCLKKSEGFTKKAWTVGMLLAALCSLSTLSLAMKTTEAGVAYSIWVAFGSVGSLLVGALVFNEKLNHKQFFFIVLIIVSVVGLKMV